MKLFENNLEQNDKQERYGETGKISKKLEIVFDPELDVEENIKEVIEFAIYFMSKNYNKELTLQEKKESHLEFTNNVSDLNNTKHSNNRFYVDNKIIGNAEAVSLLYGITTDETNDSVIELHNFDRLKKYLENINISSDHINKIIESAIFIIAAHERGHQLELVKRERNAFQNTGSIYDGHCKGENGPCLMQQVINDEELLNLTMDLMENKKNETEYLCDDCRRELNQSQ